MPAWLAPALGFAGSIGSGLLGMFGASKQNKAARQVAQAQMEFQERMSSTAYQRAMADMKKAGLNPMLAYKMGGASSPAGAMPNIQNELAPLASGVQSAANSALSLESARLNNQILKQNERKARYEANRLAILDKAAQKAADYVDEGVETAGGVIDTVRDWLTGPPDTVEQTSATDGPNSNIPPGGTSPAATKRLEETMKKLSDKTTDPQPRRSFKDAQLEAREYDKWRKLPGPKPGFRQWFRARQKIRQHDKRRP